MANKITHFVFLIFFLVTISVLFIACTFSSKTTLQFLEKAKARQYDIIAIPGAPFIITGWDSTMKARIYWSKYLYDNGITKNIMFSGSSVSSPYYEGEIMAMYAIAIGIPKEHVYVETKAEHSTENLYYSYLKSKKLGFKSIALATDPFQAKQLRRFAKVKINKEVGIIPIVFDTLRRLQPNMINPQINYEQAYNKDFVPLKDRESFWQRLRGTLGKNIDHDAYQ